MMSTPIDIKVKTNNIKQYKKGYPLISENTIQHPRTLPDEGSLIHLIDPNNQFLAKGYIGKQNKGIGWVLSRKKGEKIDFPFFKKKVKAAIDRRTTYYNDPNTTAFRVFNGEGDGIGGLTIDYYDSFYVISWYSEGIYTFKETVIEVLDDLLEYKGIYEKKRLDTKGRDIDDDDVVKGERGQFPIIVTQNGMHFAVYLNDGAMVGIFLDQHEVRKAIRDKYANGKSVLNT